MNPFIVLISPWWTSLANLAKLGVWTYKHLFVLGKCKRTCSTASKDSAKGEANKELRTASSKTTLGKRVREAELMPLKRHQTLNIRDNQARYPCSIKSPQADLWQKVWWLIFYLFQVSGILSSFKNVLFSLSPYKQVKFPNVADRVISFWDSDRVTIPPLKSDQPSVITQSTIQRILNPKVNGGATSTPGEEGAENSAVVDSSPKVPIVCDPVNPTLRSRQSWRFLKFVVSREPNYQGLAIA